MPKPGRGQARTKPIRRAGVRPVADWDDTSSLAMDRTLHDSSLATHMSHMSTEARPPAGAAPVPWGHSHQRHRIPAPVKFGAFCISPPAESPRRTGQGAEGLNTGHGRVTARKSPGPGSGLALARWAEAGSSVPSSRHHRGHGQGQYRPLVPAWGPVHSRRQEQSGSYRSTNPTCPFPPCDHGLWGGRRLGRPPGVSVGDGDCPGQLQILQLVIC